MWLLTVTCLLTLVLLAFIWTKKNRPHKPRQKYRYPDNGGCY
jgi:hypothetical protein